MKTTWGTMFELPELITIAAQMNDVLAGKSVREGSLGNTPHKFVWYDRTHEGFARLVRDAVVGEARARGKWLFLPLQPDYILRLGEWGGRILYREPPAAAPPKYHLLLALDDGSMLSATTKMWGGCELCDKGTELDGKYLKDMRPTPVDPDFSWEHFYHLAVATTAGGKRSVKGLLTQEQLIPGLGNAIAQDIMFVARLHPRRRVGDLSEAEIRRLYEAITGTVATVIAAGGRDNEVDLFGQSGAYRRLMHAKAVGAPCPQCGALVQKMQYLGGSCYFCPRCQA
jgi:formamidopyrimidine-DNA glycosylase